MSEHRACVLIPTYDNPRTIRSVVLEVREHIDDVIVVDDGSGTEARELLESIAQERLAIVHHRPRNGGKGAAVKTGLALARERGFTHALQVDADGQHTMSDIPKMLAVSRVWPEALILGRPVFDGSAPLGRRAARLITIFWTNVEAGWGKISDPMCGFRVYPIEAALAAGAVGNAMDFDPEVAVRMAWAGVPVINLKSKVHYVSKREGGVSHFRLVRDNALISWMHTRLSLTRIARSLRR